MSTKNDNSNDSSTVSPDSLEAARERREELEEVANDDGPLSPIAQRVLDKLKEEER